MSGQNTLLVIAEDAQVQRPGHLYNWQVYRNTAVAGAGIYKAMDYLGNIEIIGGPGAGSGIPFGNDTDVAANNVQVAIPGATLTDGYTFEVNILTTNTGATTLQTNALGAKSVVDSDGNALVAGMLDNESIYLFVYDLQNDRYQLLGLARPSPDEIWEKGTGVESAQLINTVIPNDASGDHSVAEGENTTASGNESHSEGNNTLASGPRAHAEGANTIASGDNSHAEGTTNTASGTSSHAEGTGTIASQDSAHAEGSSTIASGVNSHAEGDNTNATGDNSHSEGRDTTASGENSHAEGFSSSAIGISSHAEGNQTQATGLNSHSQGDQSVAPGESSHAGGILSVANGRASFNHSEAIVGGTDAAADNSAVLGGVDGNVAADSPRSVVLGGDSNNIAGQPDTAQAQHFRVTDNLRVSSAAGVSGALAAGVTVVANANVVAGSIILLTHNTQAGVPGELSAPAAGITPGVSFTIQSSNAADTSTVNFLVINP